MKRLTLLHWRPQSPHCQHIGSSTQKIHCCIDEVFCDCWANKWAWRLSCSFPARENSQPMDQSFPTATFKPLLQTALSWGKGYKKSEWKEEDSGSLSNLAGRRKTTELAALNLKSCLHLHCCKTTFPLCCAGQRPWQHPLLCRSTQPAAPDTT